jgi:hypothetical protein
MVDLPCINLLTVAALLQNYGWTSSRFEAAVEGAFHEAFVFQKSLR